MFSRPRRFLLPVLALVMMSCTGLRSPVERPYRSEGGVTREGGAIILTGVALDERRGTVLDALQGTVPGIKILRHRDRCPGVIIRSHVTFESLVNPMVYVDGTRAVDTCILQDLRTHDVASVEVYPMGFTTRPGYATHAHGLVLVFMRGAGG